MLYTLDGGFEDADFHNVTELEGFQHPPPDTLLVSIPEAPRTQIDGYWVPNSIPGMASGIVDLFWELGHSAPRLVEVCIGCLRTCLCGQQCLHTDPEPREGGCTPMQILIQHTMLYNVVSYYIIL